MCAPTKSLQKVINQLEKDIYPSVMQLLNLNMHPDKNTALYNDGILSTIQNSILVQLKNELDSLELYENRLVFPAIQAYLNQDNKDFIPDINTIEKLINNKEEKINQYISNFNEVIDNASQTIRTAWQQNGIEQSLIQLSNYFKNEFLPTRATWMHLLDDLKHESTINNNQKTSPCKNRNGDMCCCKKDKQEDKHCDSAAKMKTLFNQPNI